MLAITTWPRNAWSIFDDLESLQADMNRMLSDPERERVWRRSHSTYPLLNVWSSSDGLVIDADVPGVDPKDVDISVKGTELTLQGKVNAYDAAAGETYHRRERPTGGFVRTLQLPFRADTGSVKANYKNGVLRLTIPRSEDEKAKKITIETT